MPLILFVLIFLANAYGESDPSNNKLQKALEAGIDRDPVWLSLLHLYKNNPDISDPRFYINQKFVSPKEEFISTYNALFAKPDQELKCRFPARFLWVKTKLNLENEKLGSCPSFELYSEKVLMDNVSVVFAAENISIPASMMGHIFLKINGTNLKGENIEHAISFFTNTQDVSAIELIGKSFLTGMKGYYALSPYQTQKNVYLYNEQRNIWEYQLKTSNEQLLLLKNHLYELKDISFNYFFHWYNCATLINSLLAVPYSDIKDYRTAWVTPLDVVRAINDKKLISETRVIPASKWKIKALEDSVNVDSKNLQLIKEKKYSSMETGQYSKTDQFLIWELARGYNNYLSEEDKISRAEWEKNDGELLNQRKKAMDHAALDPSTYKMPQQTIKDSQVFGGFSNRDKKDLFKVGYLPMSHSLFDDTSQYNDESELKLGELVLSYEVKEKSLKIDSLTLYSLAIYNPTDALLGGFSWKFNSGYGPRVNSQMSYENFYLLEGGVGKTFKLSRDIDLFTLLNLGLRQRHALNIETGPEIGFMIREVWNMKTFLSFNREFLLNANYAKFNRLHALQAINLKDSAINLSYSKAFNSSKEISEWSLIYKFIY